METRIPLDDQRRKGVRERAGVAQSGDSIRYPRAGVRKTPEGRPRLPAIRRAAVQPPRRGLVGRNTTAYQQSPLSKRPNAMEETPRTASHERGTDLSGNKPFARRRQSAGRSQIPVQEFLLLVGSYIREGVPPGVRLCHPVRVSYQRHYACARSSSFQSIPFSVTHCNMEAYND
jgi:hypothetical protein